MKLFGAFTMTVVTLFLLGGNVRAAGGDAQAGKATFDAKCKMCHGADGKGNPMMAKTMNVTFPFMPCIMRTG